jgi:zinc protease
LGKTSGKTNREHEQPVLLTLPNGLRVVLQEVRFAPVVSMAVWVGVGSADETQVQAGIAHMHEHMIFKGTAKRGVGEIAREVEGAGGEINAFTSYDQTCYYLTLGNGELNQGLDILADAIGSASFHKKELQKEIQVVLEEMRLYRDMPSYFASEAAWAKSFTRHPYGRPILGLPGVLENLKRGDVTRFFGKFYRPDNLVLAVAGDLDIERTKRAIARKFGKLTGKTAKRPARPSEPEQQQFKSQVLFDPIHQAHLYLAWHGAAWHDQQAADLDIIAMILGHGYSSRLEHRVKAIKGLVHDVSAHVFAPQDPGVFGIDAVTAPDLLRPAYQAIVTEVYRLSSELVREDELERAKRNIEASFIGRRETAAGICHALGYSVTMTGELDLVRDYLQRVMKVDRNSIRAVATRLLSHHRLTATALMPKDFSLTAGELETMSERIYSVIPPQGKAAASPGEREQSPKLLGEAGRRGRLKRKVLDNGVTVVVQETAHAPIVAIRTLMNGGVRYEKPEQNGISYLTANLLARGTAKHSAITFAKIVEGMAGHLRGVSGYNSVGVAAEFLSRDFEQGLGLVAEAMLAPAFRPTEVKRAKEELIGHLRERQDSAGACVRDLFAKTLYGDHPYGRPVLGVEETIGGLDSEALGKYWKKLLGPNNLVISIAGDVRFEDAVAQVEALFGKMRQKKFKPLKLNDPGPPAGVVEAAQFMKKEQTHLLVGFLGCKIGQRDEHALQLLNAALSGQGGRLFMELRDKKHLAYSVSSFHREGVERGSFGVYIGTGANTADEALAGLLVELKNVVENPPRGKEFERAQRSLIGSLQLDLQTAGSIALTMGLNELLGQGYRVHLSMADKIAKVTPEQVARAAKKYLTLDKMVITQVGPAKTNGNDPKA